MRARIATESDSVLWEPLVAGEEVTFRDRNTHIRRIHQLVVIGSPDEEPQWFRVNDRVDRMQRMYAAQEMDLNQIKQLNQRRIAISAAYYRFSVTVDFKSPSQRTFMIGPTLYLLKFFKSRTSSSSAPAPASASDEPDTLRFCVRLQIVSHKDCSAPNGQDQYINMIVKWGSDSVRKRVSGSLKLADPQSSLQTIFKPTASVPVPVVAAVVAVHNHRYRYNTCNTWKSKCAPKTVRPPVLAVVLAVVLVVIYYDCCV